MPGEQGMDDMKALMAGLRSRPPATIAGMNVVQVARLSPRHGHERGKGGLSAHAVRCPRPTAKPIWTDRSAT